MCSVFLLTSSSGSGEDGHKNRVKVFIINNCTENAAFRVVSPGSTIDYTAYDTCKKPMSFLVGTKIYNAEGDLVLQVTAACESKDVVVCD